MVQNRQHILLLIGIMSIFAIVIRGQSTPKATVESFYKFDRSHSQVFNRRNVDARKKWFSPTLYSLFLNELRREAAYLKKNPTDKPYFGGGLPFQPIDETCRGNGRDLRRAIRVRPLFQRGGRASATATFAYPKACPEGDVVVYTIGLIKSNGRWFIDDVKYGEGEPLKQSLRRKEY